MTPRGIYPRTKKETTVTPTRSSSKEAALATALPPSDEHVVPARIVRLVEDIRKPFRAFADGFARLTEARAELAPKFMKAFNAWAADSGGTFVAFVRLLDPSVPEDSEGYRANRVYQAADYLRRLNAASSSTEPVDPSEVPVTPLVALARLVATVMPLVDPTGSLWATFVKEMHWTDAYAQRVQVLAAKEGAIRLHGRQAAILRHLRPAGEARPS